MNMSPDMFGWKPADARSDGQHKQIPANMMRAGGWRIFNSMRNARSRRDMMRAVELDWLVETDMAVRVWDFKGKSKKVRWSSATSISSYGWVSWVA